MFQHTADHKHVLEFFHLCPTGLTVSPGSEKREPWPTTIGTMELCHVALQRLEKNLELEHCIERGRRVCGGARAGNGHKNGNQAPNIGFVSKFLFVHASIVDRGAVGKKKRVSRTIRSEPAAFDHADRPNRYVWRVSARGIAWIRKIFRARENVSRCIAAARKKIGIGVILSEVDDFVVCQLIAIGLSTYLQNA